MIEPEFTEQEEEQIRKQRDKWVDSLDDRTLGMRYQEEREEMNYDEVMSVDDFVKFMTLTGIGKLTQDQYPRVAVLGDFRCTECGSELGFLANPDYREVRNTPAMPPTMAANCVECGSSEELPLLKREYDWARMSDEEKESLKEHQEKMIGKAEAYQESAEYFAKERERNAGL